MINLFETGDVDLAAYLAARMHALHGVKQINGARVFVFSAEATLGAEAFYAGASISAKDLLYTLRCLPALQQGGAL
jgi:hypothetical protein